MRTECCCGILLNEPKHDANGWYDRFLKALSGENIGLRTEEKCNACHCPHHDCTKSSCEEYHSKTLF